MIDFSLQKRKSLFEVKPDKDAPYLLLQIIMHRTGSEQQRSISLNKREARILMDKINEWLNDYAT